MLNPFSKRNPAVQLIDKALNVDFLNVLNPFAKKEDVDKETANKITTLEKQIKEVRVIS